MCGLSLAWVTSENSTSTSNADILSRSSSQDPILSPTVSGAQCWLPLRGSTPTSLFASLLSSRNCPLLGRVVNCLVRVPRQLPPSHQLSFASPYHFRIRRDFMSKNPLSGFAPKQTRLLWRPTHIVLHTTLSYPCHLFSINYNTI